MEMIVRLLRNYWPWFLRGTVVTVSIAIIGTAGKSSLIDRLIKDGKIEAKDILGKNEKYIIKTHINLAGKEEN